MSLAQDIKGLRQDREQILVATSYHRGKNSQGGYLIVDNAMGHSCDSSDRSRFRMSWVMKAEAQFVKEHQTEILALAAQMIEKELDEAGLDIDFLK